jgi:hypothetical protein
MAQVGPSEAEQRAACMGDAIRLCAFEIPDRSRIQACLARHHGELSQRCLPVFDASAAAGNLPSR